MRSLSLLTVLALAGAAAPALADEDPAPCVLEVHAMDEAGACEVTVEGPMNVDGSIALGPRIGLILSQSEPARETWGPLVGRRVRARGEVLPGTKRRGARSLLKLLHARLEAIDEPPAPGTWPAPWPRVAARVVVRGVLTDRGGVLVSRGVAIELLLPRPETLARCTGRRVELTGEVLSGPWRHEGVSRFTLDTSYARLLEDAPASRDDRPGLADALPGAPAR